MKKNIIQLVQEVLNHTKDYSVLSKLTPEEKSQSSFIFDYNDQVSRIEYVLQTAHTMSIVFEFEVLLDLVKKRTFKETSSVLVDLNLYTVKRYKKPVEYYHACINVLYKYFTFDYQNVISHYFTKWKLNNPGNDNLIISDFIFEEFSSLPLLVKELPHLRLDFGYAWNPGSDRTSIISCDRVDLRGNPISGEVELEKYTLRDVAHLVRSEFKTNKVEVLDYYHAKIKEHDTWYIEKDGSLKLDDNTVDYTPMEIVTSYYPVKEFESIFNTFYSCMDKHYHVKTNYSTGFHVNLVLDKPIDFVKLIVMTYDTVSLTRFDRQWNGFCQSQYSLLKNELNDAIGNETSDVIIDLRKMYASLLYEFFPEKPDNVEKYKQLYHDYKRNMYGWERLKISELANEDEYDFKLSPDYYYIEKPITIKRKNTAKLKLKDKVNPNLIEHDILPILYDVFSKKESEFMDKMRSINFLKYDNAKMIEFRIIGDDYLGKRRADVFKTIQWFVFMMGVASEPELYKEEYFEMINEMIQK